MPPIISSGIGGLPTIEEEHAKGEAKGFDRVSPFFVPMSIANMAAGQVAIRFGLKGMCTAPVTACAGGTNAIGDAFHRIRDGYEDLAICGGAESCISLLGVGGFTSMKALNPCTDPAARPSPLTPSAALCLGEGAGILVLEELTHAQARGAKIYAEVVGYGANCDAYHFTAPAPGGEGGAAACAWRCKTQTLRRRPSATSTPTAPVPTSTIPVNGGHQGRVWRPRLQAAHLQHQVDDRPSAGRGRRRRGHLHGAGPARRLPARHHRLAGADPECDLDYLPNHGVEEQVDYALSDSLGFGGHNACVIFKRWEGVNHGHHR